MFQVIVQALSPIFMVVGLGYFSGFRKKSSHHEGMMTLNIYVMKYALPAILFTATWSTPWRILAKELPLSGLFIISSWSIWILTYFISRKFFHKHATAAAVLALTVANPNVAGLGFPILGQVIQSSTEVSLDVAVLVVTASIFSVPWTLIVLEKHTRKEYKDRSIPSLLIPLLYKAFKSPIVFWSLLGFILSLIGTTMPDLLKHSLKALANAAAGSALFLTGMLLSSRRLRITPLVLLGCLIKNIIQPFFTLLTGYLLGVSSAVLMVAVLMTALATGFFGVMFGHSFGVRDEDAESTLLASTILIIATVPLFMYLVG